MFAAANRSLRVSLLEFGCRVVAVELAVVAYRRWWSLKIGYDHELRHFSPGVQLTHDVIHRAFDEGLEAYEFLGCAEEWERLWNPDARRFEMVVVYPGNARGMCALAADAGQFVARRTAAMSRSMWHRARRSASEHTHQAPVSDRES